MNITALGDRLLEVRVIYDKHFWHKPGPSPCLHKCEGLECLGGRWPIYAARAGALDLAHLVASISRAPCPSWDTKSDSQPLRSDCVLSRGPCLGRWVPGDRRVPAAPPRRHKRPLSLRPFCLVRSSRT